ncbi:DUF2996 domain-containing protein [Prochlorococcus sp. MIT 1223]|uniref:DUF2996 domain-containing protein n=1 Tax=Prochlorococcus sp. MIT 1223 TaxID=3096217 RepID=UPI002A76024D|nr:DUF2996 domain-containing protein [Prochlorococcus sp. MIT 1223]
MSEIQKPGTEDQATSKTDQSLPDTKSGSKKPEKPPKLEDKPFEEFINDHLIPDLITSFKSNGILQTKITLEEKERPVVGGKCWILEGTINQGRRFWLCFAEKKISSSKTFLIAETGSEPSLLESFLIDEKKTTLPLLRSRILQRLNGQKWLLSN